MSLPQITLGAPQSAARGEEPCWGSGQLFLIPRRGE